MFFVGCASVGNINLNKNFWENKQYKIGVAKLVSPKAFFDRRNDSSGATGVAGTLDTSIGDINRSISDGMAYNLETFLPTLKSDRFDNITDLFVKELNKNGMHAKKIDDIDLNQYIIEKGGIFKLEKYNIKSIAEKEKIDILILLYIDSWGCLRRYAYGIPKEKPKVFCNASGVMIDMKKCEVVNPKQLIKENSLWAVKINEFCGYISVGGEWENPPYYENIKNSIDNNFDRIKSILFKNFFGYDYY
jgi:hypothetical protein